MSTFEELARALTCSQCGHSLASRACGPTHAILARQPERHRAVAPMLAEAWDEGWQQGAWDVEENGWEPHDLGKGSHPANPYRAEREGER